MPSLSVNARARPASADSTVPPDDTADDTTSPSTGDTDSVPDETTVSTDTTDTSADTTDTSTGDTTATSTGDSTTGSGTPDVTPGVGEIEWDPEGEVVEGVQLGYLEVPVDYEDPEGPTFTLALARHLATDQQNKIGTLLVNPGGPGFGGSDYGLFADQVYGQSLLDNFDILGWDPRGTGVSTPAIDCTDDYEHFLTGTDITPDDDVERQLNIDLAEEFADACVDQNGDIVDFVGTNNSARDMNSIREALGEDEISYFGFSYGSELGATWATLFPDTVRAAVLDGASDPNADLFESALQQTAGFENTLGLYLASCSSDSTCAFHSNGHAEEAFDKLMKQIDEEPLPTSGGRADLTRSMALTGVANAMYDESYWPQLSDALVDARNGDGDGLLALFDDYYQRQPDGTYGNELEAFQSIVCMDAAERPTVVEEDAEAEQFRENAPRVSPATTGSYFCTFYPDSKDPRIEITGDGAGPIIVVGTTGDPATPIESSRAMAEALDEGVFVEVDADQHTGYGVNDCIDSVIEEYLVDLTVPPADTKC